ncbi:30 kDa heat shock protein [Paecilomyces variotii No. 5]|uniref:30 kDa heat shock protein n=1 Tax=Byssochlamys spectabilis (strain No. 5 / NBRC 109023) TaxID=1356009 RepID=V5G634_BYSSN|nr:30 kDa heat shock protein [Paecilomyces variotii No. 5]
MSLFPRFPAGDFAPLFRLLDDYDVHRASRGNSQLRSFAPKFDVRETNEAYHLDGELPGINQKDVDIEFSDPQTLVIKGRTEREYHSPEAREEDQAQGQQQQQGQSQEVTKTGDKQVSKSDQPKPKYWVSERSIGEFHRSFSFPTRVDQDNVKASLKNGILSVVIPKASAPAAKKITISE